MKGLRSHGFNQRPRFEQVAGYIERGELAPGSTGPKGHVVHHEPLLLGRLCAVQRGLAGTIDFAAINESGQLVLFDWKRTKDLQQISNFVGQGGWF